MATSWKPTVVAVLFCFLSIPVVVAFNHVVRVLGEGLMVCVAAVVMVAVLAAIVCLASQVKNKLYYGFTLFAFTSAVDMFVALEADGIVSGYMDVYLRNGEPYLFSVWGSVVAYWDSTFYLTCYLVLAHYASNGYSYRSLGLYYSASIMNSMVVLLVGAALGQTGLYWCTLLNIPYVILPLVVGITCLNEPRQQKVKPARADWLHKVMALLLVEAAIAAVLRGTAGLGSTVTLLSWYREVAEPILGQNIPAPFAGVQGAVALFYFAPAFLILAAGILKNPGQAWLQDLAILVAGATSQAGVAQVGMSLHPHTEEEYRAPSLQDHLAFVTFWSANILISVLPQLVAVLLWTSTQGQLVDKKGKKYR